jgi:superfamily I DNA/RNA helicase/RecB family exonuclease
MDQTHAPAYRLIRRPLPAASAPCLDEAQQRVVDHEGGPLLVLAGPGTGKTTTIVAAVADRIERRGIDPERVLVLTFSRKAAAELRERITARLRRTTREPLAMTFHSYAYALARREFVLAGDEPPRLLSAPEQLLEIRRMLRGEAQDGGGRWPERLRPALATRGFAEEVRDLLLRAAERGLDGRGLRQLGKLRDRDDWMSAAAFLDRYAARFDLAPVPAYDYAEIVRIAAALLGREQTRQRERGAYDVVLVDEYQDSDPAQESMLLALAGDGRELIAVGDPDQSIYAFRGADVRALTEFPERFRTADGQPAPVVALRTCRRSGPVLLAASRRVARRLPRGFSSHHRDLLALPGGPAGEVRILVADSSTQEAALVADTLRRAHLADGVPWSSMAVLVRSAARQVPLLRRALTAAGVPVTVAGDEMPLADEPGTRPLLMLLRCALRPSALDEQTAVELLCGPLGGTDALGLRRLRRSLQLLADVAGARGGEQGGDLIAGALRDPRDLAGIPDRVAGPARQVARLLAVATEVIRAGGNAEDVLWAIWDASGLAEQWQSVSAAGGPAGPAADRDLDAVLALFDQAAHFTDTMPPGAPGLFAESLAGQEIVGDTLAERAVREDCVRILTAHRSKGLEWEVVVVAGVQEDTWPDLRLRGSLLGAGELAEAVHIGLSEVGRPDQWPGSSPGADVDAAMLAAKLLAEERRLFYVAVTRARRLLVVTAAGGEDTDQRPSRFLTELAGDDIPIERVADAHGGHRWLSMPALVADLRRAAADAGAESAVRQAAAAQLARLAAAGVRAAHPREWYALTELSDAGPIVAGGETVRLSPSQVESFTKCGLRWLLEAAVGAGRSDVLRHLGTVIHAAAVLAADGATEQDVADRIDEIWHHLDFGSPWYSSKQRALAERMVRKFLDWHAGNPRDLVAVEQALKVRIGQVEITGRVDRLESDDQGRAVVVDLKTGGSAPREDELDRHPQLGVYQLAVLLGAFERFGLAEPGGAELVQVGKAAGVTARAKVQRQGALAEDPEPSWAKDLVETVAAGMAGPVFEARVNPGCRTCPVASCCPVNPEGEQVGE